MTCSAASSGAPYRPSRTTSAVPIASPRRTARCSVLSLGPASTVASAPSSSEVLESGWVAADTDDPARTLEAGDLDGQLVRRLRWRPGRATRLARHAARPARPAAGRQRRRRCRQRRPSTRSGHRQGQQVLVGDEHVGGKGLRGCRGRRVALAVDERADGAWVSDSSTTPTHSLPGT